jgi:hypothetical protein
MKISRNEFAVYVDNINITVTPEELQKTNNC